MPSEKTKSSRRFNLRGKATILIPEPTLTEKARAIARVRPDVPGSLGPVSPDAVRVHIVNSERIRDEDTERLRRNLLQALIPPASARPSPPRNRPGLEAADGVWRNGVYVAGDREARFRGEGLHEYVRRMGSGYMLVNTAEYERLRADSQRLAAIVRGDTIERPSEMFSSSASDRARHALEIENIRTLPLDAMLHHLDLGESYYLGGAQHGRRVERRYLHTERVVTMPRMRTPRAEVASQADPEGVEDAQVTQVYERRVINRVTTPQFVFVRLDLRQQEDCLRDVLRSQGTRRA